MNSSLLFSFPYLLLVFFLIFLSITEYAFTGYKLIKSIVQLSCLGLFLFFFGLRGFIGWDFVNYYPLFNDIPKLFSVHFISFISKSPTETGFLLYTSFIKTICNSYIFYNFVNTLIDLIIINIFLTRYSPNYALGFLMFLVLGGFYLETDLLRNAKSIMLFILSIKYLLERNTAKYFIFNLIGMTFHVSSIFYLPLYFIAHRSINRNMLIILFIIGNILFLFQIEYIRIVVRNISEILGGRFTLLANQYFSNKLFSASYGLTIGYVERLITAGLVIMLYKRLLNYNSYSVVFINLFIYYFIIFFFFGELKFISVRVGSLFLISYWILIPTLFEVLRLSNNKFIFLLFFFFYSVFKTYGMTNSVLFKYDNVLFSYDKFNLRKNILLQYQAK